MPLNIIYSETYYRNLLSGWNRISYPTIRKIVISVLEKYKPITILDLGCGNGIYLNTMREYTKDVYGVDASKQSVDLCKQLDYRDVKLADAKSLPFPNGYFDFVLATEVLEHIEQYAVMLKEINRVLKNNGVLLLTTTCYSTAIFEFLKMYRGSVSKFIREVYVYASGFASTEKRNAFVRKWCFKSLGGHYHGFIPSVLAKDISNTGMTIQKKELLYVIPAIPYSDTKGLARSAISRNADHFIIKRMVMLLMSLTIFIVNPVLQYFGILANNVYIVAKKGS